MVKISQFYKDQEEIVIRSEGRDNAKVRVNLEC